MLDFWNQNKIVHRMVYRQLYRLARRMDVAPHAINAMISAQHMKETLPSEKSDFTHHHVKALNVYNRCIDHLVHFGLYYVPKSSSQQEDSSRQTNLQYKKREKEVKQNDLGQEKMANQKKKKANEFKWFTAYLRQASDPKIVHNVLLEKRQQMLTLQQVEDEEETRRCIEGILLDAGILAINKFSGLLAHANKFGIFERDRQAREKQIKSNSKPTSSTKKLPIHTRRAIVEEEKSIKITDRIESGIFLVSHPLLQYPFCRSVILLTEHPSGGGTMDEKKEKGKRTNEAQAFQNQGMISKGFIINQPTQEPLGTPFHVKRQVRRYFGSNRVHYGGPVPMAQVLHTHASVGGRIISRSTMPSRHEQLPSKQRRSMVRSQQGKDEEEEEEEEEQEKAFHRKDGKKHPRGEVDRLFVGGDLHLACDGIRRNRLEAKDFLFLHGSASWKTHQLEEEIAQGCWIPVSAPLELALHADYNLWEELLQALDPSHASLSALPETLGRLGNYD